MVVSSEAERVRTALGQLEWDATGTITLWAGRCSDLFGWTASEAVGQRIGAIGLLTDEQFERTLLAGDGAGWLTFAAGTKSGAIVESNWFVTPTAAGGCAIVEQTLPRGAPRLPGNLRFRTLIDRAPTALVVLDLFGRIRYSNDAALALIELDRSRPYGDPYLGYVDERDRENVARLFRMSATGNTVEFEMRLALRSGRHLEVTTTLYPVHVGDRVAGVCAQIADPSLLRYTERQLEESRERFRSLFEYHPDSIALVDRAGSIQNCNVALTKKTGFELEELIGKPVVDVLAMPGESEDRPRFTLTTESSDVELYLRRKGRADLPVHVSSVPVVVREEVAGTFLIARDISAQRQAEQALTTQSERLRALYMVAVSAGRSSQQQIIETLKLGVAMFAMETGMLGEFEGTDFIIHYVIGDHVSHPPGSRVPLESAYVGALERVNEPLVIEDALRSQWAGLAKAEKKPRAWFATPIDLFGRRYGAVAFYAREPRAEPFTEPDRDLLRLIGSLCGSALEQAAHDERLDSLAFFDALTSLPNRVLLNERLGKLLSVAQRGGLRFAIMYVDIDFFKRVNDEHGHTVGDEVLRIVGKRLSAVVRQSDTVARMGGDEFIVLQVLSAPGDARRLAQRIRDSLQAPMDVDSLRLHVSASVGIAYYPQDARSASELVGYADQALYRAKADGRNRIALYSTEPTE